jgi:hypothetical protein
MMNLLSFGAKIAKNFVGMRVIMLACPIKEY